MNDLNMQSVHGTQKDAAILWGRKFPLDVSVEH